MRNYLVIILTVLALTSCSGIESRIQNSDKISMEHGFKKKLVETDKFRMVTYYKIKKLGYPLYIYIEGDGHAFKNRHTVSDNPTPTNPIALKLALNDSHPNVAYIARPCQFLATNNDPECGSDYWTTRRYSLEVVESVNKTISIYKLAAGGSQLVLTGYSGGGTISVIVSAMRDDVIGIRTIAGNLDIDAFSKHHNVTTLAGSLNPVDFAKHLYSIPQLHLVGEEDKIVPGFIASSYVSSLERYDPSLACVDISVISGMEHAGDWESILKRFENYNFICKQ